MCTVRVSSALAAFPEPAMPLKALSFAGEGVRVWEYEQLFLFFLVLSFDRVMPKCRLIAYAWRTLQNKTIIINIYIFYIFIFFYVKNSFRK